MTIIEQLHNGEYYPSEYMLPSSAEYTATKERMYVAYDALNDQLTAPQQQLLDNYAGKAADVHGYISLEAYRLGMQFGLRLFMEIMGADDVAPRRQFGAGVDHISWLAPIWRQKIFSFLLKVAFMCLR